MVRPSRGGGGSGRRGPVPVVVLVSVLLVSACAGAAPPDPGASPSDGSDIVVDAPGSERSTVRVALVTDPVSIDPREVVDAEGDLVVRALFDGLVDIGLDGAPRPAAAASWTVEDDGLTYRFLLRPDRFHDGTRVTAQHHADALLAVLDPERRPRFREDLVATLRGALRPGADQGPAEAAEPTDGAAAASVWGLPADVLAAGGIEVVDVGELVLRLDRPDPFLLFRLADPVLVPLPDLAVRDPQRFAREPVGNGPFRMLGPREPGDFIRLGRWAAHPQPPHIEELVLQVYGDDHDGSRRWADLRSGRLQISPITSQWRGEARERFGRPLDGRRGPGLHELPLASTYAYGFAVDVPPFDDVRLRRAVAAAIDRDAIARALAAVGVEVATTILPPGLGGTPPTCPHCVTDPDVAAAAIAEWRAARQDGSPEPVLTLTYPRGEGDVIIAERIAADLERVLDLDVRLQSREAASFVRLVEERRAPLFRLGLVATVGGEAAGAELLTSAFRSDAVRNQVGWTDPTTDALLDAWEVGAPVDVVRGVEQRLLEAAVVVPLVRERAALVVSEEVGGFHLDLTGRWWPELLWTR